MLKKIDKLVLGAFIGPFTMTFLVVVFVLLTQHMLKYFDDIIGKGLGGDVIGQLLFYFAIFMTPVALPLAVLLSSLIAFGNLGEHFELTAIKSAGVSLVRVLRPIFFFVILLTGLAFYANNNLVPKAALEAYSLLYDIKQKKPALDLREGTFYNGINDISIKVDKKFPEDDAALKNVIVYDHRKNDGNKEVTVADSGRMYTILNERYLKFELFNGYNYMEGAGTERELTGQKDRKTETLSRSKFTKTQVVFDLSSFDLERTDKKWFEGNRIMRNVSQLDDDIDSIQGEILNFNLNHYQYRPSYFVYYAKKDSLIMPAEVYQYKLHKDSVQSQQYFNNLAPEGAQRPVETPVESSPAPKTTTTTTTTTDVTVTKTVNPTSAINQKKKSLGGKRVTSDRKPQKDFNPGHQVPESVKKIIASKRPRITDSLITARIDSLLNMEPNHGVIQGAANFARQIKGQVANTNTGIENAVIEKNTFETQWHKIFASSFACLAMFLIGAPLGAIIKKGGLGVPFLVSILFFIFYYVVTMQGEKLAKQGTVGVVAGVWAADFILFVIGLFFLRQARIDARLFEADFYSVVIDKIKRWFAARKATS